MNIKISSNIDGLFRNPLDYVGKYYCKNSDGIESADFLEIIESQETWSAWTPWSKCKKVQVDQIKVG